MEDLRKRLYAALQRTEWIAKGQADDYLAIHHDALEELLMHVNAEMAGQPQPLGDRLTAEAEAALEVFNREFPNT